MVKSTKIQWCDSTVNPIMGCGGCELFEKPGVVISRIDAAMREDISEWRNGDARRLLRPLLAEAWERLLETIDEPKEGHVNKLTTTNIYHLRHDFKRQVARAYGKKAGVKARHAVEKSTKCYAAKQHFNKGRTILDPERNANTGYAPTFEIVARFEDRIRKAAKWSDLRGTERPGKSWLKGLPRLIFVSDMGDAFTRKADFPFLRREVSEMESDKGIRHLWLWLTKRPEMMAEFAEEIGGMPPNVCAMTTVTSNESLYRVDQLREVDASVRGLSIEPLWSSIADNLDLDGIDWVIVGGESGAIAVVEPFEVEWAEELRQLCRERGVAFFCKQLGRKPTQNGDKFSLSDKHGGDWNEWKVRQRVRKFPRYFHTYRPKTTAV